MRVQIDPAKLATKGLTLEDVRGVIASATTNAAKGTLNGATRSFTIAANDQLAKASDYDDVIIAYRNGAAVRVKDVGQAVEGPENLYTQAWDNNKPAVLLVVSKQPGANVIETVDLIKAGAAAAAGGDPAGDQRRYPLGPHRDHPRLGRGRRVHPRPHHRRSWSS